MLFAAWPVPVTPCFDLCTARESEIEFARFGGEKGEGTDREIESEGKKDASKPESEESRKSQLTRRSIGENMIFQ